jgi:hypothetical protein
MSDGKPFGNKYKECAECVYIAVPRNCDPCKTCEKSIPDAFTTQDGAFYMITIPVKEARRTYLSGWFTENPQPVTNVAMHAYDKAWANMRVALVRPSDKEEE